MSHEKTEPVMMAPAVHDTAGMYQMTAFDSLSAHESFDNQIIGFYQNPVDEFLSHHTVEVLKKIRELDQGTLTASDKKYEKTYEKRVTFDEQLFDARAAVKILISQVSMHFGEELREKLFHQIDLIHDPDDWEEGDKPIQLQSFKTFLRWFYISEPQRLPNFGLSAAGHFIAAWLTNHNKDRLILEFMSNDRINWFVTKYYDGEVDNCSGSTSLSRIADILAPYQTNDWYVK